MDLNDDVFSVMQLYADINAQGVIKCSFLTLIKGS